MSEDRPSISDVLYLLEQARAESRDEHVEMNKLQLIRALHIQPRNQAREIIVFHWLSLLLSHQVMKQDLHSHMKEVTVLQQQLQTSKMAEESFRKQLTRKEAELTSAQETIQRQQQKMRQQVYALTNEHVFCNM